MKTSLNNKAYGRKHKRLRKTLLPQAIGQPCPVCKLPMEPWQPLDLGHSTHDLKLAGQPGDRIEHTSCNRADIEYRDATRTPTPLHPRLPMPSRDW